MTTSQSQGVSLNICIQTVDVLFHACSLPCLLSLKSNHSTQSPYRVFPTIVPTDDIKPSQQAKNAPKPEHLQF